MDAADLALNLGVGHPEFLAAKVDMDQKLALLTEEEKKEFVRLLDARRGTLSARGDDDR